MSEDDGRDADARSFILKARLLELGRRTNGHACVRLLAHLALFALTSFVLFRAVESSRWWLLAAIVGHGSASGKILRCPRSGRTGSGS